MRVESTPLHCTAQEQLGQADRSRLPPRPASAPRLRTPLVIPRQLCHPPSGIHTAVQAAQQDDVPLARLWLGDVSFVGFSFGGRCELGGR